MSISLLTYNELTDDDINIDLHMHTNQTDGEESVEAIIQKSVEKGLKRIAITEHVRSSSDWFDRFEYAVRETAYTYPMIEVLVGAEAKVLDKQGNMDISEKVFDKSDIILGSVHSIPDGKGGILSFNSMTPRELAKTEYELAVGMLNHSPIDVLAHPGGMYSTRYGGFPIEYIIELMILTKENNKAIEISSKYTKNVYDFLTACGEINPAVSIGSDVHNLQHIGKCKEMLHQFEYKTFQRRVIL